VQQNPPHDSPSVMLKMIMRAGGHAAYPKNIKKM
jgi:hypothetical protein